MKVKHLALLLTGLCVAGVGLVNAWAPSPLGGAGGAAGDVWIHVVLGLDAREANWSGYLEARRASVAEILPWGFEHHDRFDPEHARWECITVVRRGRSQSSFAEPYRGLFVALSDLGRDPEVLVHTAQGDFTIKVGELSPGHPTLFLDGRASAQLVPSPRQVSSQSGQNDFPTLAVDKTGHTWVAWIQFDEEELTDRLYVQRLDRSKEAPALMPAGRYVNTPQLVASGPKLALFWTEWDGSFWHLKESWWDGKRWSTPRSTYKTSGHCLFLRAAGGPDGAIWLVWQGLGPGGRESRIECLRIGADGSRRHAVVATPPGSNWEPAVDVDRQGIAWIAYDSYRNGSYDVCLRDVRPTDNGLQVGPLRLIAASPDFEAHADVDAQDERFVWVAYDAAGPNWGGDFARYDTRRNGKYAEPLHASRRIELRVYDRRTNRIWKPTVPLPQVRNPKQPSRVAHSYQEETIRFYELPQFTRDDRGRLWVLYRLNRQGYCGHPPKGAVWELCAVTFLNDRWTDAIILPKSRGRQEQKAGIDGSQVAWASGHHHVDLPYTIFTATLPDLEGEQRIPLAPVRERTDTAAPSRRGRPRYRSAEGLELLYGDLHRHTEISLCTPTVDGSLTETYRYALDVAQLDFIAVTDHTRDTDPYPWWLTQKAADMFYVPGHFVSIYAYERSNAIVNGGHRNVFFRDRNWPVLRSDAYYGATRQPRPDTRPNVSLYPRLRGRFAFTIAHTPGFNARAKRGTWTYNDPQVEPVAEIFQAYRRDYERPDPHGVPERASLWYALGRGYRLGFIASSDHHSTHLSFAGAWAKQRTREGVFRAIQARHTFGAMDQIMLEMRVNGVLMGGQAVVDDPGKAPEVRIRVRGTAPISEIQLIRSARVVRSLAPNKTDVDITITDTSYAGGPCYYYVRVRQADGITAWGSPVWVGNGTGR